MKDYLGHSANSSGREESLKEHLERVARYTGLFGKQLGIEAESVFTALLHDIGKMGGDYQKRLSGTAHHVDHWSFGAYLAKKYGKSEAQAAALAILGHHVGLGKTVDEKRIDLSIPCEALDTNLNLSAPRSDEDCDLFLKSLCIDPRTIVRTGESFFGRKDKGKRALTMADTRMLYSILVDADFLATEGHFRGTPEQEYYTRPEAPLLCPKKAFESLQRFMTEVKKKARASDRTILARDRVMQDALQAAEGEIGNYTLTAPTGSGKTLAMLAFALKHAAKWNLQRVIVVIPFLTIIEQTAKIYRDALAGNGQCESVSPFILEDHSRIRSSSSPDDENKRMCWQNLMAENWDAPIIITTNIQFFESLFSNRPSACRKLHRMANSVILFDEVQTMPDKLAVPTLATLTRLCHGYGSTLLMATATQPAFTSLSEGVQEYGDEWAPKEIVGWNRPDPKQALLDLFQSAKRTEVTIVNGGEPVAWSEIARRMVEKKRALCIVNLKKHARQLIDELVAILPHGEGESPAGLYHLSTGMCPDHRTRVLATIRTALDAPDQGQFTLLVATQCVEAGVDIDFPNLFRAFAPLDSIAQAIGRCNRNDMLSRPGQVFLFMPEQETTSDDHGKSPLYPGGVYQRASEVSITRIKKLMQRNKLDFDNPRLYRDHFNELYELRGIARGTVDQNKPSVLRGMENGNFQEVADEYRLIDEDTINILIPYDREIFDQLVAEAKESGVSGDWMTRAREFTVTCYRAKRTKMTGSLGQLPLRNRSGKASEEMSDDWFYLLDTQGENAPRYDDLKGLCGETDNIFMV